jgi:histidinol phosphatase-like PHP family hydrolase
MNLKQDHHVHSIYNDHSSADLTVPNAILEAEKKGMQTLAITEHVRMTSDWVPDYLHEIESTKSRMKSNLQVIAGFEAKILQDGSIDCLEKYASEYFIIASFHTHYPDKRVWLNALEQAIENPSVDVIGHLAPEPSFTLEIEEVKELADLIVSKGKIVELNAKYQRPPLEWITIFKEAGVKFHLGSDAHSLHEIGNFHNIQNLISLAS